MSQLHDIFGRLKAILKMYENPLVSKVDTDGSYDLWSVKNLIIEGRKRKEIYFAGIMIQKDYVGFYFMPVYSDAGLLEVFKPELLKLLKGKSCFHIKKLDDVLEKQIEEAVEKGFELYKERGWI